ncbi:hypothetical protein Scep_012026 [Stephania cephalantha]|uniref:Uncharacterized protein n=1 Tax=Stephania cephalantha TaxID=152367 RepID=A0AAP0JG80_9MAGN
MKKKNEDYERINQVEEVQKEISPRKQVIIGLLYQQFSVIPRDTKSLDKSEDARKD